MTMKEETEVSSGEERWQTYTAVHAEGIRSQCI